MKHEFSKKLNKNIFIEQSTITEYHEFPQNRDYAVIAYIAYGIGVAYTTNIHRKTRRREIYFLNKTGSLKLSAIEGDDKTFEIYYVLFRPEILGEQWEKYTEQFTEISDFIKDENDKILNIYDSEQAEIRNIIVKMISEYYEDNAGKDTMLIGYIHLLVTTLFRRMNIIDNPLFSKNMLVDQTIRQIKNTIYDNPTTSEIAAHRFVTREHLGRVFKKETGLTITQYINMQKVEIIKDILKNTDRPIEEIPLIFNNKIKYIQQIFKKYTGITMREYRKKNKK